ncbi:MAG: prolipoprotein diacylglyceryl transferase [Polyangiaceae bacterium]|nr:prolipoprotein diacylglyceryl transferase [Polyangiaceae bacterium]
MIPYWPPPSLSIFGIEVSAFGICLFSAVLLSYVAILIEGRRVLHIIGKVGAQSPFNHKFIESLAHIALIAGIIGAHLGGIFIEKGRAAFLDSGVFLSTKQTFSSTAGLICSSAAVSIFIATKRAPFWACGDVLAKAFWVGLIAARIGCALAHDHLGKRSHSLLAVNFPAGPRFDCGLLELIGSICLFALWMAIHKRRYAVGTFFVYTIVGYALLRFGIDFLRADDIFNADPRYASLTFSQWVGLVLIPVGIIAAVRRGRKAAPATI